MVVRDSDHDPCARALALLKRHGHDPTSFQILEPGLAYWFDEGDRAVVAYTDTGSAWVTVGEPVCAPEARAEVVARFRAAAREAERRVRFFHVSGDLSELPELSHTHVGELPVWDPQAWETNLKRTRSLREQLRRARAKGVRTRLAAAEELREGAPLRTACDRLIHRWLAGKHMSELKFMVRLAPYGYAHERRYAVAEQEGTLRGVAVAIPIYAREGWFIEDLLRDPEAPNGTAELLVDALMHDFADRGARYATLGLAPLAGEVRPLLAFTRQYTSRLYNFPGVRSFKDKLRPERWEPVHLAYPRGEWGLSAMRDVLAAFAPAGLVRFGLQTLVHQRTLATTLLATLLVPWTLALLCIDTATWFPSPTIQRAWAGFDLLLIGLMFALVRRWRAPLAVLVVALTSLDAAMTTLQVLLWNVWTARGPLAWSLVVLGCTGPLLAASFFWSVRRVAMQGRHSLA